MAIRGPIIPPAAVSTRVRSAPITVASKFPKAPPWLLRATDRHPVAGRVLDVFTSALWPPGDPIAPPASWQAEGARARNYTAGSNLSYEPRSSEGRLPFDWLITLAATYDTAAICIQYRREEMAALDWAIVPRSEQHTPSKAQLKEAAQRVESLDSRLRWDEWVGVFTDEVLVTDALTISLDTTRKGEVIAARLIAGETIKPLIDGRGDLPAPMAPAFQQVIQGAINWECIDATQPLMAGSPIPAGMPALIYSPKNRQTRSAYGKSPTEMIMLTVNRALRRQSFDVNYYADGNIPEAVLPASPEMTREQVEELQLWLDTMTNDPVNRRKLILIPHQGAFRPWQPKANISDPAIEEFLDRRTTAAYGVTPNELGWTTDVNRSTSEGQENVQIRRRLPYLRQVSGVVSMILWSMGYTDVKLQFLAELPQEDEQLKWDINERKLKAGEYSMNDLRKLDGLVEVPGADGHYYYTAAGFVAIPIGVADGMNPNPTPGANASDPMPPTPLAPMPGGPLDAGGDQGAGATGADAAGSADGAANDDAGDEGDESGGAAASGGDEGGQDDDVSRQAVEGEALDGWDTARAAVARDITTGEGLTSYDQGGGAKVTQPFARVWDREYVQPGSTTTAGEGTVAAGLAVEALDTGRVLLIQRAQIEGDPADGKWEIPGGHLDDGESSLDAARREWQEEIGCVLPPGKVVDDWQSAAVPTGGYQGFVYLIQHEGDVRGLDTRGEGMRAVLNPDDPDSDGIETARWCSMDDLRGLDVRAELAADLDMVIEKLNPGAEVDNVWTDPSEEMARSGDFDLDAALKEIAQWERWASKGRARGREFEFKAVPEWARPALKV